jgi:hypothetical protein
MNTLFIAAVNLFYPAEVLVAIVAIGEAPKTFVDSNGDVWNANELSNLVHPKK